MHRADYTAEEAPASALRHYLTFLMSHPIWGQEKRTKKPRAHIADAILFLASGNGSSAAQQEPGEDVRVFAPYVVKRKKGPRIVQTISVSRSINVHDLDLTLPADSAVLEQRVTQAAQDICRELDSRYSSGDWNRAAQDRFGAQHASASALAEITTDFCMPRP